MKYWAFLSYSHADTRVCAWLHRALETYRVPKALVGRPSPWPEQTIPRQLRPVFRDREELPGSSDLGRPLREALTQSCALIVICSPRAAASRWVNEEVKFFKSLGRADHVFCLIAEGEPNASARPESGLLECFPPAIRFAADAAGNLTDTPAEPVAADLRLGKDGKNKARLKLIAGLLGVGFDDLRRRERTRQRRRQFLVAVAVLTMIGIGIGGRAYYQEQARQRVELARRAQESAAARQLGRRALLVGDDAEGLRQLDRARGLAPPGAGADVGLELMRGLARQRLTGLARVFQGRGDVVGSVEVAADGRRLLALDEAGTADVWDVANARSVCQLGRAGDPAAVVREAQLDREGRWALIGNSQGNALAELEAGGAYRQLLDVNQYGHAQSPFHAAWCPDGQRIAGVFPDEGGVRVAIWEAESNQRVSSYTVPAGGNRFFSPSHFEMHGARAFVRFDRNSVCHLLVWEWESGRPVANLLVFDAALEISPDGTRLLQEADLNGKKTAVAIRSVDTGETLAALPTGDVHPRFHWSPSGRYILSSIGNVGGRAVWDAANRPAPGKNPVPLFQRDQSSEGGTWLDGVIDPAERIVALRDDQGNIECFELPGGAAKGGFRDQIGFSAEKGMLTPHPPLIFTPDGEGLFSADRSWLVKLWRWREASRQSLLPLPPPPHLAASALRLCANGSVWVTADATQGAVVREASAGRVLCQARNPDPLEYVLDAELSPDGSRLVTAGNRAMARLWDTANGRLITDLHHTGGDKDLLSLTFSTRAAFSPVGDRLATAATPTKAVALREGKTGREIAHFQAQGAGKYLGALRFSPDGAWLLTVDGGEALIHAAADGAFVGRLHTGRATIEGVRASPDGRLLLTWTEQGATTLWEWPGGRKRADVAGDGVRDPQFSADAREILAGCADGKMREWESASGKLRRIYEEEKPAADPRAIAAISQENVTRGLLPGGFLCAASSPDGRWVAGGNAQGIVCVWNRATGEQLARFAADNQFAAVIGLFFSPDGARLTSVRANGGGWIWTLPGAER